jgi:AcrR family transcriptional regulator
MVEERKPRERLLDAAATLLASEGPTVSTRAICEAAGVTAPTLYHYFGDRDGLLAAVVTHGFSSYLDAKRTLESTGDPVADLRIGWDNHIAWGTANPNFYALMYGQVRPGHKAAAASEATELLRVKLEAAARAGLLTVPVDLGVRMIMSANVGLTLQLISDPDAAADDLSARVRDATFAGILRSGEAVDSGAASSAVTLKAALAADAGQPLAEAELALLDVWLDRIALAR